MKISTRLALAAAVAVVGCLVLAGFTLFLGQRNNAALEQVYERSAKRLTQLQKIDAELREVRFRAAGMLLELMTLQGSLNHLKEARTDIERTFTALASRDDGADGTAEVRTLHGEVRQNWSRMQAVLGKLEKAYGDKDNKSVTAILEEDWPVVQKSVVKPLQALIPAEEAAALAIYQRAKVQNERLALLSIALALACVASIVVCMVLIMRRLRAQLGAEPDALAGAADRIAQGDLSGDGAAQRAGSVMASMQTMRASLAQVVATVRDGVEQVVSASAEIAQGSSDLSGRTEAQASSLQQSAASMEQLTGTVRTTADHARMANQLAVGTSDMATRGGGIVSDVVGTMSEIQAASRKIAEITGVIDGIAFQTNILALNAAVEAARAGEQGRGFAVVAGEVRALAQRSAEAARQIKSLIADSVQRVDAGNALAHTAGATMKETVDGVRRVSDLIGEITAASTLQSDGIGQVGAAISQLDSATQQNAALVEQSSAAARNLNAQATRLADAVAVFRL